MLIKLRKGQSTAEYAILISIIIGAALAMQVYIKRSLQAKMYDAGNALTSVSGDVGGATLGTTQQYEPDYASSYSKITTSMDASDKKVIAGGAATSTSDKDYIIESQEITGYDE